MTGVRLSHQGAGPGAAMAVSAFKTICEHLNIRYLPTVRDKARTNLVASGRSGFLLEGFPRSPLTGSSSQLCLWHMSATVSWVTISVPILSRSHWEGAPRASQEPWRMNGAGTTRAAWSRRSCRSDSEFDFPSWRIILLRSGFHLSSSASWCLA